MPMGTDCGYDPRTGATPNALVDAYKFDRVLTADQYKALRAEVRRAQAQQYRQFRQRTWLRFAKRMAWFAFLGALIYWMGTR